MKHKLIHFMGICGTGMSSLAGMFKELGYKITGSDQNIYPPISEQIKELHIDIKVGYKPENLENNPNLIIVGNSITKNNPEAQAMLEKGIPYMSFPQALYEFFLKDRYPLVVVGTHGKTTTSSLLAWILESSGLDPGFMIGGVPINFGRNYKIGNGKYFVVEGDEYDTAFFDKGPKFMHYNPKSAIITSIEFDHADIYKDLEEIKKAFSNFIGLLENGILVINSDDPNINELTFGIKNSVSFGFNNNAMWRAEDVQFLNSSTEFATYKKSKIYGNFRMGLSGMHNIKNALSVVALLDSLGLDYEGIRKGIETFLGVKRRQELIGEIKGVTIIDDFAHHPTKVRETTSAIKSRYPNRRLWTIFEPRTNTSRRNVFQKEYVSAFLEADKIVIAGVYNPEKIDPQIRFSPSKLVEDLTGNNKESKFIESVDDIVDFLSKNTKKGDVILIMSNGGFGGIQEKLVNVLSNPPIPPIF